MGFIGGAMEHVLLSILGGHHTCSMHPPPMDLGELDALTLHLQMNAINQSTSKAYATGAHDYVKFCMLHALPLDPTPLYFLITLFIHHNSLHLDQNI